MGLGDYTLSAIEIGEEFTVKVTAEHTRGFVNLSGRVFALVEEEEEDRELPGYFGQYNNNTKIKYLFTMEKFAFFKKKKSITKIKYFFCNYKS